MNPIIVGCIVFTLLAAALTVYELVRMDPGQRNTWLQHAAHAALMAENLSLDALKGLTPEQEKALCSRMNTYLNVHGIRISIRPAEVEVIMAELRLLLTHI